MPNRRRLTRAERESILAKTHGHCAYCGNPLDYKDMQVDHIEALRRGGEDDIENMLPACRSCNHYKSSLSLDGFRQMLEAQPTVLARDSVTYEIAVRYGLVQPQPHKVIFYFEKLDWLRQPAEE